MGNKITNNRIEWIDTAKGMGLILVVLGHLHIPFLASWIYLFHMPLFFFLSGVVYSGQQYSFLEFLTRRIKTLVVPYFFLGSVIWLFYVVVNEVIGVEHNLYGSDMEMLRGLIVQEHFWTIWFLTALFLTEMLYYLLDRWMGKHPWWITVASALLCVFGLLRYRLGRGSLPWNLDVSLVAQFFFHGGRLFCQHEEWQRAVMPQNREQAVRGSLFLLGINVLAGFLGIKLSHSSLDMSVGLYGNEVLTIISAFAGTLFVINVASRSPLRSLKYLGRNTMIVFAWHSRIVIEMCRYIYAALGIFQESTIVQSLLASTITFFIIFLILVPCTELIKKSKIHTLFGV